ncbi:putative ankyrin repeat and mynd domain containing [Schistosoma mansoni]|uniref:putative ankyrin repeat and mynd domain containing n=1 Tax=Schistosoma mansoni TaxID=6183 RepID=UPI0001A62FB8|nr:putative ankyrin repeat and mynd domain containing [Schistosoma mansoni]|eukprot:XP_018648153.1 putative ankyrin repeat and mynd domain containing [Schistosoma mansoni]
MSSEDILDSFRTAISTSDIEKVKSLLSEDRSLINSHDKEGLSPLQLACFRGKLPIVEFLLKYGANVNSSSHKQGYTALMFAALSGNIEVVELLLHYGARINDVNSIGKTASQMAAFVGNHNVVTLINNYLEREEIAIYVSKSQLLPEHVSAIHQLVLQLNISPIKVFLLLNNEIETCSRSGENYEKCMLTHWRCIHTIFEDLCNKYFTPHLTHEPLSLKFHLLACCIRQAGEYYDKEPETTDVQDHAFSPLKQLIRKFLVGTEPYGLPLGQEQFLRQSLTSFPHHQSTLWRHIVQQISPLHLGHMPTALSVLTKTINGTIMYNARPLELCATCGDGPELGIPGKLKACQQCKITSYCSVSCQRLHWFTHKKFCPVIKKHKKEFEFAK